MRTHAKAILGMDIHGHVVHRLWVEHASDIAREYYASFTLDRAAKLHLCMVSAKGGVEIEEVAATDPTAIAKLHVDPVDGLSVAAAARAGRRRRASTPKPGPRRRELLVALYRCYVEGDCDLAEINPLILTTDGRVHALDAKVTLDDNATFRHPEWEEFAGTDTLDERELLAKEKGLNYIGLSGSVGIIANGAGLAMSTLDVVTQAGGTAANFLDIGGGANAGRHGGGPRGHQHRPGRAIDLREHLRRHHPLRRGGQRHRRGPGTRRPALAHRVAPRRHQRRSGSRDPRPPHF